MTEEIQDYTTWANVANEADRLMAFWGKIVSPAVSEISWSDKGVEYKLRRATVVVRTTDGAKMGGHITSEYTLTSFNTHGLPEGKMVTFTVPDAYLEPFDHEPGIGLDELEPPQVWAMGALTVALNQREH